MSQSAALSRRARANRAAAFMFAFLAGWPLAGALAQKPSASVHPPPMGTMPAPNGQPMGMMEPSPGVPMSAMPPRGQPMGTMEPGPMHTSEAALVRTLLPTVVNISSKKVYAEGNAGEGSRVITLTGSGFIVEPQGVIATNYHVIDGAYEVVIAFWDGSRAPAKVMAATRVGDIAILKVDVGHPLPAVHWGDSDQMQIGDPVIAIGNPLGIGMSVSSGIVSALHRDIMASPYDDFIQTDAPINHGNSGGPLFNMRGEVIGIDTAIYSPTSGSVGIGFAIPATSAQFVIGRLEKYGAVRPGWIGASLQQVTPDIAEALDMREPTGAIMSDIDPAGPAEKAGLRVGDVILSVDGKPVPDSRALMRAIAVVPAGKAVTLGLLRDGKEQHVPVAVDAMPSTPKLDKPLTPAALERAVPPNLGLTLAPFDDNARTKYGLDFDQPGVLVTAVARNTDAADRGMLAGDVILQVQDKPVSAPAEVEQQLNDLRAAKHKLALFLVQPKLQPEAETQQVAGKPAPATAKMQAMGLQWGPPKWVALRLGNG